MGDSSRRHEAALCLLLATWAGAVLLAGGVRERWVALAALALSALTLAAASRSRPLTPWLLLLGAAALYLVPLPLGFLKLVSPVQAGLLAAHDAGWGRIGADTDAVVLELAKLGAYVAAGVAAYEAVRGGARARFLLGGLVLAALVCAGYGLVAFAMGSPELPIGGRRGDPDSLSATFVNRNHFAGMMAAILPAALALLWRRFEALRHGEGRAIGPILLAGGCVFLFACLVMARSRGGFVAACVGAGLVAPLVRATPVRAGLVAVMLLAAALTFWTGSGDPLLARVDTLEQTGEGGRWAIWASSLSILSSHWAVGLGPGAFASVMPAWKPATALEVTHAHNDFLETAVEFGVPITLGLFWLLWRWFRRVGPAAAVPGPRQHLAVAAVAGAAALLVHGLFDFNLRIPSNGILFATLLGAGLGAAADPLAEPRSKARLLLPVVATAGFALVVAGELSSWIAPWEVRARVTQLFQASRPEDALAVARDIVPRAPLDHRAHFAIAASLFKQGDPAAAEAELEHALRCGPHQRDLRLKAGLLLLKRAQTAPEARPRALESMRIAAELDGTGTTLRQVYDLLGAAPLDDLVRVTPPGFASRLGERLVALGMRVDLVPAMLRIVPRNAMGARHLEQVAAAALKEKWVTETAQLREAACSIEPTFTRWLLLASSWERLDDPDRAGAAYERALAERPGDVGVRLSLARLHASHNRPEQAAVHYRAILETHPRHREAALGYAANAARAGRPLEAIRVHELLLAENPTDRPIVLGLARLLIAQKETTRARELLEGYVAATQVDPEVAALLKACRP